MTIDEIRARLDAVISEATTLRRAIDDLTTPKKGGREKKRETPPLGMAEYVLAELARCVGFRGRITPGMADAMAKLHASEQPTLEEWTRVIEVRAGLDLAGDQYGTCTWEHLCRPANFRRYRDGVPKRRGPAAPSPRPTISGTYGPDGSIVPLPDCPEDVW